MPLKDVEGLPSCQMVRLPGGMWWGCAACDTSWDYNPGLCHKLRTTPSPQPTVSSEITAMELQSLAAAHDGTVLAAILLACATKLDEHDQRMVVLNQLLSNIGLGDVKSPFTVGDKVNKRRGYRFPGTVRSVFINGDDEIRYVVELDQYKLLHIFNGEQLEHDPAR